MAEIGWGKPTIICKKIGGDAYIKFPAGIENSTILSTTKGAKKEAKIEGGENEDVRYGKNTYALAVEIRDAKNRKRPLVDHDGIVEGEYEVWLQPEDKTLNGIYIAEAVVSVEDKWSAENGTSRVYTFDALKPADGSDQVKHGVVTITGEGNNITAVEFIEDTDE